MNPPEAQMVLSSADVKPPVPESQPATARKTLEFVANAAGAFVILGLGIASYVYFGRKPEIPTDDSAQNAANVAPLVDVAVAEAWDKPFHLYIDGEATTYRILTVGAEVTGRVLGKPERTRSGTFVNQGDLLFEIDSVNYELEKQRLSARVDQAREELQAVVVDIQNTETLLNLSEEENQLQKNHLERIRTLYERKATSESEMDSAARQELTSRNALQTQLNQRNALIQTQKTKEASLKLALAELKRTMIDLERCKIVSPIDGRIVDDVIEVGDYVKPGDPLVHVSDSARMEIKCSLKSEELAWVWQQGPNMPQKLIHTSESASSASETDDAKTDDAKAADPFKLPEIPCKISFEFQGVETNWDGRLSRYEGTGMDRETRMFPCRILVEDTQGMLADGETGTPIPSLLSGMYVTVQIPITSPAPLLQVPAEAVRPGEQLWVFQEEQLRIVSITLVRVDGESALVQQKDGTLRAGDKVITSPLASVSDGMQVALKPTTDDDNTAEAVSPPATEQKVK